MKLSNSYSKLKSIKHIVNILNKKEVIAYPTEAVFGLGCDPDSETAVKRLLKLKKRSKGKGLILVSSDLKQLEPYINFSSLKPEQWKAISSYWPGPVTFVFPTRPSTPLWLRGQFNSLAVRITSHPVVIKLCRAFGKPLVSTSANINGSTPCLTVQEIREQFNDALHIIDGKIGNCSNPSEIRDALTGERFR